MKLIISFATAMLMTILSLSLSAAAAEPVTAPGMADYIRNARTPEDQQVIAAHFDVAAAKAKEKLESFDIQECEHVKSMELQRSHPKFSGVMAKRQCRAELRRYANEAQEYSARADYHRKIAEAWRASTPSTQ